MTNNLEEHGLFSSVQQRTNHKDFQNCLFACFLSQEEPKKVDLPNGKRAIDGCQECFYYGKIEEEVYVYQPPGFEDPDFPDKVYKRGKIDKTLFIRKDKGDILLVQVYVDDIIFGSTKKSLCTEFEKMIHKKFQMISMGELTFFLGLQVKQKDDGIFISQDKYVTEILKKFGFTDVKTASKPMETQKLLLKDEDGEEVDVYLHRSMISSLMYLTSSRHDIMFVVYACARYQVNPKVSHLHVVKRIFRYLKGQPKLSLWYLKDSPFDLVAYTDSDYARASLYRKSTTGVNDVRHNLLLLLKVNAARHKLTTAVGMDGKKIIVTEASVRCDLQLNDEEGTDCLTNATIFEELTRTGYEKLSQKLTFYKAFFSPQWKFLIPLFACLKTKTLRAKRKDTEVPQPSGPTDNVADEAVYEKMNDSLVRAAITAFSLEAEQDSGSINKTRSKATLNELSSLGTSSGNYKFEKKGQETIRRKEGQELIGLKDYTRLVYLEEWNPLNDEVHDLVGDEVVVESEVASKDVNLNVDEVTLAQALAALKSAKPKADKLLATTPTVSSKGLVIHEQEQATTPTVSSQQPSQLNVHDKELTFKIQAEKEEEERLAREKAQQIKEANIVSWDNVQAMIDADYQMAQQMQARTRRV
ncbi:putative ribonuclease H-like domain-containing protein [Tanacetum coccineum]